MIDVASGTLESGIRFIVSVSEPVETDELREIGNLLHGGATKLDEEAQDLPSPQRDELP